MATTHHDSDGRLLWLQILNSNSSSVTVSAPLNANLAPPGYYMIHVLNSAGVPSIAAIIKVPGSASEETTAPTVVSTNPSNSARNVPGASLVRVTFSEPMLSSSITSSTFTVKVSGSSSNLAVHVGTAARMVVRLQYLHHLQI